jgi:hypothetical protein
VGRYDFPFRPICDSVDHAPDQHSSGIPDAPRLAGWIGESLAVVLAGIYARYLQHQTVGEGAEQEGSSSRPWSSALIRYSTRTTEPARLRRRRSGG